MTSSNKQPPDLRLLLTSFKQAVQASGRFKLRSFAHRETILIIREFVYFRCQKLFWLSKILNVYNFKFIISIFGRNWLIRLVPSAKWLSLSLLLWDTALARDDTEATNVSHFIKSLSTKAKTTPNDRSRDCRWLWYDYRINLIMTYRALHGSDYSCQVRVVVFQKGFNAIWTNRRLIGWL